MELYITLVIIHILIGVAWHQMYKVAVTFSKDISASTVILQIIGAITFFSLTPFFEWKISSNPLIYLAVFGITILSALADRLQSSARKHIPASNLTIIDKLDKILIFIVGIIIFKEVISTSKIIGAILIFSANIVIFWKNKKIKLSKYYLHMLFFVLIISLTTILGVNFSNDFNVPFYFGVYYLMSAFWVTIAEKPFKGVKIELKSNRLKPLLITGILWSLSHFTLILSYQNSEFSTIAPMVSVSSLLIVITSYFTLKEKEYFTRKIIASLVIFAGVYLLTIK